MTAPKRSAKRRKNAPEDPARELLKKSGARPPNAKIANALGQPQNRWQRTMRYTWDKNRGRG
jgi:hypothetical protein